MYEITRLEETKDRDGNDEIFFNISISDDLGIYNFAHWMTSSELSQYKADATSIDTTVSKYLTQARINKLAEIEASKVVIPVQS